MFSGGEPASQLQRREWRMASVREVKPLSAFKQSEADPLDASVMNQCQAVHSFLFSFYHH